MLDTLFIAIFWHPAFSHDIQYIILPLCINRRKRFSRFQKKKAGKREKDATPSGIPLRNTYVFAAKEA